MGAAEQAGTWVSARKSCAATRGGATHFITTDTRAGDVSFTRFYDDIGVRRFGDRDGDVRPPCDECVSALRA